MHLQFVVQGQLYVIYKIIAHKIKKKIVFFIFLYLAFFTTAVCL
jgi:hypothetical protein